MSPMENVVKEKSNTKVAILLFVKLSITHPRVYHLNKLLATILPIAPNSDL